VKEKKVWGGRRKKKTGKKKGGPSGLVARCWRKGGNGKGGDERMSPTKISCTIFGGGGGGEGGGRKGGPSEIMTVSLTGGNKGGGERPLVSYERKGKRKRERVVGKKKRGVSFAFLSRSYVFLGRGGEENWKKGLRRKGKGGGRKDVSRGEAAFLVLEIEEKSKRGEKKKRKSRSGICQKVRAGAQKEKKVRRRS